MLHIVDQDSVLVEEDRFGLVDRHAVFSLICRCLAPVPRESEFRHENSVVTVYVRVKPFFEASNEVYTELG